MAKADPELRFKCLELCMRLNTHKVEAALVTATRFIEFIEEAGEYAPEPPKTEPKTPGQPAKAPKTAGKTAAKGSPSP